MRKPERHLSIRWGVRLQEYGVTAALHAEGRVSAGRRRAAATRLMQQAAR